MPGLFYLYLDPVTVRDAHRVPFIWENPVPEFDFSFLRGDRDLDRYLPTGYASTMTGGWAIETTLSNTEAVLEVDLNKIQNSDEIPRRINVRRPIIASGRVDGILL